jgi:subtilisin family serine protease
VCAAALAAAMSAKAQLLGGRLPLSLPSPSPDALVHLPPVRWAPQLEQKLDPATLLDLRRQRLDDFVRAHRATVERDEAGNPVVRGRILAFEPDPGALEAATKAGFDVQGAERLEAIGVEVTILAPPRGVSATAALRRLRAIDPSGSWDYDHLYFEAGASTASQAETGRGEAAEGGPARVRVGLIDTGVDARNPALKPDRIEARGFAPGAPAPRPHGTATAALIAGESGTFRGSAPGATVLAADVYGTAGAGDALGLARALAWMAQARAPVVNVSLVGPANRLLEASVRALTAHGQIVVAAVGNDGPAAPPMYPASYPDVVAVSGVDGRGRPLLEAGRASHVEFCAPGADMAAPAGPSGFAAVRGTSFAAPLVAGLLARELDRPDSAKAREAVEALGRRAAPAGPACGRGIVAADLRTPPQAMHAGPWPQP